MWTTSSAARTINYNLPPEMGMFVVAPTSFHHHHHHIHDSNPINPSDHHLGGPAEETEYLTNRYSGGGGGSAGGVGGGGIQFWQQHQQNPPQQVSYGKKQQDMSLNFHHNNSVNLLQNIGTGGTGNYGGLGTAASSSGTATCQDCGNQSKKDCPHRRCRTCCKSRGYDCTTHVKSTWVPASRRRERQLMAAAATPGSSTSGGSGTKKPRLLHPPQQQTTTTSHTSTSNTTPPRSFDATSSHQDGSFKESLPGQVRAPATFKCVRVTAVVDGDDEYAYQAVVKIGGHVFKGFLYDQGVVGTERDAFPSMSELNLGGGGSGGVGRNAGSSPILVQGDVYAAATGGALLGGSSDYGNQIN